MEAVQSGQDELEGAAAAHRCGAAAGVGVGVGGEQQPACSLSLPACPVWTAAPSSSSAALPATSLPAVALWPYMVPLLLVYFAEYAMQSGTWTAIGWWGPGLR